MPDRVLTSREEILDACEGGGVVIFKGDDPPFSEDEDDGLVACKVTGPDGVFFVIGGVDKREHVEGIAREFVEKGLGGTVTHFKRLH